ncbi:MAG: urea ABC transporter ATP-binding subunit UrtE [Proteobacteria bacterium]|nr:urea ABC transporter ATP-binding subunit UrtE [Pseudomonadota bacterium]
MFKLSKVNTFYGKSHALFDINLHIPAGEIFTIMGRNGVGKTTLLRCLLGLTDHTNGKISLGNINITNLDTYLRARAGIAYVPQGREIIPDFSVSENILMGGYARHDGIQEIPQVVTDLFPYLKENMDRSGGLLSGGQQQQLAIARALAANPKVLLMDEPTEGIQPNIARQIEETIIRLNSDFGITVVLVEQNVRFAREAGHNFAMLEKGSIVVNAPIEELSDELVHKHMTV